MKKRELDEEWTKAWEIAHMMQSGKITDEKQYFDEQKCLMEDDDMYIPIEPCPVCPGDVALQLDANGLRLLCPVCGLVVENFTDEKPEWAVGNSEKGDTDTTRGEAINPLMPHSSMNTDIVPNGRLAYRQYKMIKLSRWSSMTAVERSLCVVFSKIERCGNRARVPPPVQYTTKTLFRRVYEVNLKKHQSGKKREGLRGPKRDGLIAACNYMAFKAQGLYWKKDLVAAIYDITPTEIRRGISIFWDLVKDCPLTDNLSKITGCKQYIRWYAVELGLSHSVATFSIMLFRELKMCGVGSSKQPQSIAAWCLWTVCQALPPSASSPQIELSVLVRTTGISRATITDVERITSGMEVPILVAIFAVDMCNALDISNKLTIHKIGLVAKALCRTALIDMEEVASALPKLSAFAIYFVYVVNNIRFDEKTMFKKCGVTKQDILFMSKMVVPFRDAIIEACVGDSCVVSNTTNSTTTTTTMPCHLDYDLLNVNPLLSLVE